MKLALRLSAVAFLIGGLTSAGGNPVTFQGLGDLGGGHSAFAAFDVSGDGSVVVGASFDSGGIEHGFRWSTDGNLVIFDAETRGISTDGKVVVGRANSEAFRWTSAGGLTPLGDLPGGPKLGSAYAASADGSTIVGFSYTQVHQEAFRWTSAGGMTSLGPLASNKREVRAAATSADGNAVVGFGYQGGSGKHEAFRWTTSGGMVALGYLPGGSGTESYANSISADGTVVVGSSGNGLATVAYRWTASGGMVPLNGLDGTSQARDVSADGQTIVGYADRQAMLWTEALGMVRLKDYLIARGASGLTDWHLKHADAISADGRTIIGEGVNPDGKQEAWIATIPEPSTLLLAIFATISLLTCRVAAKQRASAS